jgi:hypothetical protein
MSRRCAINARFFNEEYPVRFRALGTGLEDARGPMAATETEKVKLVASVDLERLKGTLVDALVESDFLYRRLFRGLRGPVRDAEFWQGRLWKMLWKMRSDNGPLI